MTQTRNTQSVIIFGAGASYGAGGILPYAPPLGNELFDKLAGSSPSSWGQLPREDFATGSFERGMSVAWEKNQDRAEVLKQLMDDLARFFMQFKLGDDADDCYSGLLHGLATQGKLGDVKLATLNYDTVLEQAIELAALDFVYSTKDVNEEMLVLKIHGSANWIFSPPGDRGQILYDPRHDTEVDRNKSVYLSGGLAILGKNTTLSGNLESLVSTGDQDWVRSQLEKGFLPCLAAYMEGKPYIGFTDSFARFNQRLLEDRILGASSVILCGIKPNSLDEHLWKPLVRTEAKLGYVGNVQYFDEWNEIAKPRHIPECLGERFCDSVRGMIDFA